jgi:pimeloyl-ACP methyl ester carboxylesterase
VKAPAQIITGENDGGCNPRLNRLIHQALPGSDLVILPHLKQAIFIEATDQVLPHVRDFLLKQG